MNNNDYHNNTLINYNINKGNFKNYSYCIK